MRHRHLLAIALAAAGLLTACGSSSSTPSSSVLPTRKLDVGAVEVAITPTQLDNIGATFTIALDTHSVDLSLDVAAAATLVVNGKTWPVQGWSGSSAGGHHREGELRFAAAGPPSGTVRLTITGLPEPVEAVWDYPGT